jgi:hypothetical protein
MNKHLFLLFPLLALTSCASTSAVKRAEITVIDQQTNKPASNVKVTRQDIHGGSFDTRTGLSDETLRTTAVGKVTIPIMENGCTQFTLEDFDGKTKLMYRFFSTTFPEGRFKYFGDELVKDNGRGTGCKTWAARADIEHSNNSTRLLDNRWFDLEIHTKQENHNE